MSHPESNKSRKQLLSLELKGKGEQKHEWRLMESSESCTAGGRTTYWRRELLEGVSYYRCSSEAEKLWRKVSPAFSFPVFESPTDSFHWLT